VTTTTTFAEAYSTPSFDLEQAQSFLTALHGPGNGDAQVVLWLHNTKLPRRRGVQQLSAPPTGLTDEGGELGRMVANDWNVYVTPCRFRPDRQPPHSRRAESVVLAPGTWADLDVKPNVPHLPHDRDELVRVYQALPRPTVLVGSGSGGLHAYWLLPEPTEDVARAETLERLWIRYVSKLAGEALGREIKFDSVKDLARVLRLPGTVRWPKPKEPAGTRPAPVTLHDVDGPRYRFEELETLVPEELRREPEWVPVGQEIIDVEDPRLTAYARKAVEGEARTLAALRQGESGGRNTQLNKAAFKLGTLGAHGLLGRDTAYDALRAACERNGLNAEDGVDQFDLTFTSGWEAGLQKPRKLPASLLAQHSAGENGTAPLYEDIEPWPEPVDGALLLDELVEYFAGPMVLPPGGAETCALYTAVTYITDLLEIVPYLGIPSAVMRSGKTRLETLFAYAVRRPLLAANATPAAIFRECEANRPTLIIDEAETFLGSEELRGVLNAGYDREGGVLRSVPDGGGGFVTRHFNVFGPKIFALIGGLPGTLLDRSILVVMRRKKPTETVAPFRRLQRRDYRERGRELGRKLVRWTQDRWADLDRQEPDLPLTPDGRAALDDRAADNWEALLIIADVAGGDWPKRAREIAIEISAVRNEQTVDDRLLLLADVRAIFNRLGGQPLTPSQVVNQLYALEERPWAAYGARETPITADRIGKMLASFNVTSQKVRTSNQQHPVRLYWPALFEEAWERHRIGDEGEPPWEWK
jgi:putative DNA primase/helicase